MVTSIFDPGVQQVFDQARSGGGTLFQSPEDWRDVPIYFLMLDRFDNPATQPRNLPFDASFNQFQGGSYAGAQAQLSYVKSLGFGALWLSPVLKNRQSDPTAYHGYGIQNFLIAEPRFATNPANADQELRDLVDAAHRIGLYVIFDIVLHHTGDVFSYVPGGAQIDWQNQQVDIRWRDAQGNPNPAWASAPLSPPLDAAVFPDELRRNELFTRQGNIFSNHGQVQGDFDSLKGLQQTNGEMPAANVLIRAYQYIIARFDVDAFRIDTLKFIPQDFERTFANAMREFALSAGKKNFFTFGEVYDNEQEIAQFIGRNTNVSGNNDGVVGVDAALDYPLFFVLPGTLKGLQTSPADLAQVFANRKQVEQSILTSHGDAGQYFVTFLDNHDQSQRFGFTGPTQLLDQISLGLACLFSLQGIPCVYYGTEQGLSGHKDAVNTDDSMVREALWGKSGGGFDPTHPLYLATRQLLGLRGTLAPLRYGRQYFRQVSGDGSNFGLSPYPAGVLAFSRILNDQEVVLVANLNRQQSFTGEAIIDSTLHSTGAVLTRLFSNQTPNTPTTNAVLDKLAGTITIDGATTGGLARSVQLQLQPGELQILA